MTCWIYVQQDRLNNGLIIDDKTIETKWPRGIQLI